MKIRLNGDLVRQRRNALGRTLDQVADESGVNRQTIHRIESQHQPQVRKRTADLIAKALRTEVSDLCVDPQSSPEGATPADGTVIKNAYWLVAQRYRIAEADIVRLAPLLFTLVAEDSLAHRKSTVREWEARLKHAEDLAASFRHFPPALVYLSNRCSEAMDAEIKSIKAHDLFGDRLYDALDNSYDLPSDYSSDTHNPFVTFLTNYASRFPDVALVWSIKPGSAGYTVLKKSILEIACEDEEVSDALTFGPIRLSDIPKNLLDREKAADRLAWLKSHLRNIKASWPKLPSLFGDTAPSEPETSP